jgi:dTDP-4-amino-4,6-dideoxygalactose transaminase
VLRVLLPRLPAETAARRELAAQYRAGLSGLPLELPPEDTGAVYHQFAVTLENRDELRRRLAELGIGSDIHYPRGVHQEPRYAANAPCLPRTEHLVERLLSLPIQPEIAQGHVPEIVRAVKQALDAAVPR